MRRSTVFLALVALLAGAARPSPAHAQAAGSLATVRGIVRDSTTGVPVGAAFVQLLDAAGRRAAGALTDSLGGYALRAAAGRYRLRVEAIAYATPPDTTLELPAGATRTVLLRLRPHPLELEAIGVKVKPRCRLNRDTVGAVLAVWTEARKALTMADWSARASGLVMVTRTYDELHGAHVPSGARTAPRRPQVDTITGRPPFRTLGTDSIRHAGLVQYRAGGFDFFAPGPEYVLSDDFLSTHCFTLRAASSRVGLDFTPYGQKQHADIQGTLWLDRASGTLAQMDFRYTNVPPLSNVRGARGDLEFGRTPAGLWLIRSWLIRMPVYSQAGRPAYVKETRGEVVQTWRRPRS